jgi:hypothetical protein
MEYTFPQVSVHSYGYSGPPDAVHDWQDPDEERLIA